MLVFESGEAWLAAHAGGAGTGRFVGRALLDSLTNGSPLVALRLHFVRSATLADFVFSRDEGQMREVIRCRFGSSGSIDECEIWRVKSSTLAPPLESGELLELLRGDTNVEFLEPLIGGLALRTPLGTVSVVI